jgi:hypothetical protein
MVCVWRYLFSKSKKLKLKLKLKVQSYFQMQNGNVNVVAPAEVVVEQTESKLDKNKEQCDVSLVPFLQFYKNIDEALETLNKMSCAKKEHKEYVKFSSLVFTLHSLKALKKLCKGKCALFDLKRKLHVGLMKENKKYENSAVSMSAAVVFFDNNPLEKYVWILNSDIGGIVWQCYTCDDGPLRLLTEFKAKKGASPYAISLRNSIIKQKPKGSLDFDTNRKLLAVELGTCRKISTKLKIPERTQRLALVTGKIPQNLRRKSETKRTLYENHVKFFFAGCACPAYRDNFCLDWSDEIHLELIGMQRMYDSQETISIVPSKAEILVSFSTKNKKESANWSIVARDGAKVIINMTGMNKPDALQTGHTELQTRLLQPIYGAGTYCPLDEMMAFDRKSIPVIALRADCVSLLENDEYAEIKRILTKENSASPMMNQVYTRSPAHVYEDHCEIHHEISTLDKIQIQIRHYFSETRTVNQNREFCGSIIHCNLCDHMAHCEVHCDSCIAASNTSLPIPTMNQVSCQLQKQMELLNYHY